MVLRFFLRGWSDVTKLLHAWMPSVCLSCLTASGWLDDLFLNCDQVESLFFPQDFYGTATKSNWLCLFLFGHVLSLHEIVSAGWYRKKKNKRWCWKPRGPGRLADSHFQVFNDPLLVHTQGSPLLHPDVLYLWGLPTQMETGQLHLNFSRFLLISRCEIVTMDAKCKWGWNSLQIGF